jgi:hypothetical protein
MDTIFEHKILFVKTLRLIKYLEINAYKNNTIRFRYISKHISEYVEKEQLIDFDIKKLEKFKNYIINFPKLEILDLDIEQLFIFMNLLIK